MARTRTRTVFICQQCSYSSPKWVGRCPECGEWNTLVETVESRESARPTAAALPRTLPQRLSDVATDSFRRVELPMTEFNRTLGGGVVPGSLILIGGDPGIGKSTLLLQISALLARKVGKVLYVSGEESVQQIKMRAQRLGIEADELYLLTETNLNAVLEHVNQLSPQAMVVDSIQTMYLDELTSAAGSVSQVRECTSQLLALAKGEQIPVFVVGHVTKAGAIAGPRVLEHIVDTVLYLEGERFHSYRLLRSVKNRFGSTHEVGVFEMTGTGMVEVTNPSEAFLAERSPIAAGSTIAVTLEGTRPLLVEIQALTSTTSFGLPRRTANGIDFNRLLLLVAVLSKRVGLRLSNQDVFVNVVGGLRVTEPAADLSVAVAIASSFRDKPVASDMAVMGEIGLSGELRSISQMDKRLNEAVKLGFKRCLIPKGSRRLKTPPDGVELIRVRTLAEALEASLVG
ncbi:MAG: DNA repair protein RadA [Anaerolineae bacterium]